MKHALRNAAAALALAACASVFAQQGPVTVIGLMGLAGSGAAAGINFDNSVKLAVKQIDAAGGMLGRKVEHTPMDTQSAPRIANALAQKAVDQGVYVIAILPPVHPIQ